MTFYIHDTDLPEGLSFSGSIAVDTETMGLNLHRDRLCVVQISAGDGSAHLVKFSQGNYNAPRLKALLADPSIEKIFHFARFDVAVLYRDLGVFPTPLFCTKIASRLTRTSTDRHGLKELVKECAGVDLSKQQQTSDWGVPVLSEAQVAYAASDVLYLHTVRQRMEDLLQREGRRELAQACFDFLPTRAVLDLQDWAGETDIFNH